MLYVGIDNGISGSVAILDKGGKVLSFEKTPTKREISYTKKKQFISRVDVPALRSMLRNFLSSGNSVPQMRCLLERPFTFPGRLKAMLSGFRALEATLIVLEELQLPYRYVDSKERQKGLLPSGLKGPDLKTAAANVCERLFPMANADEGSADSLLIAEWARRTWK